VRLSDNRTAIADSGRGKGVRGAEEPPDLCRPSRLAQLRTNHSNTSTAVVIRAIHVKRNNRSLEKMRKQVFIATIAIVLGITADIDGAMAAETGTKTMPDSSVYPPPTPAPVFETDHHWCYLPSDPCDNQHDEHN
jgi:hypothetical protein